MLTGPQRTSEQRGELAEAAGMIGAVAVGVTEIPWLDVNELYRLPGWETCPLACADVTMADALCIPVVDVITR
ncbi:hypothetical protein [Streptomyces sp. NPDC005877]|uniref:hypothetical protein n=2 Tax=unclassified Streptomyces TaxID=2593676 RepID=UPI00340F562E